MRNLAGPAIVRPAPALRVRVPAAPGPKPGSTMFAPEAMARRSLRICLVAETVMTGVGRHVADVVRTMAARGHEVHLLHSIGRADHGLLQELATLPGVSCRGFAMRREPHGSDLAVLLGLARYLWRHGPFDAIHGHSSKGGFYARALGLLSGTYCLYTPHAFVTLQATLPPARRRVYAMAERVLGLATDRLICVSTEERQHAIGLGIAARRLRVIANGLDDFDSGAGNALRRRLGLPADAVVIGFVGRMDQQKAPQYLVEAGLDLVARDRRVQVVMVGDGPLRAGLEARTRRAGHAARFSWCGQGPGRAWITAFDILAMPSLYEGFSYVLLEALHAGVPVVCTPVGGVSDVLVDGVEGFVVPFGDTGRLAERLAHLAGDAGLRATMGSRGRERAALFSLDRMMDLLEATYLGSRGEVGSSGA